MELPSYPANIDTPETLMIFCQRMRDHSLSIQKPEDEWEVVGNDWASVLEQINAALFWASSIKQLMENKNEIPS